MKKITKVIVRNCRVNYSEMESQVISELQFSKFSVKISVKIFPLAG